MGTGRSSSLRTASRLFFVAGACVALSLTLASCDLFKVGLGNKVDIEPPVISITSPEPNFYTGAEITVAGTVADDTGLSTVRLNVLAGGTVVQTVPAVVTGGTWTASIDSTEISDGNRRILAVATDAAGKQAETALDINIDNSAPVVLVSVPQTESSEVYNTRISFRGTVYDASPIQSTLVKLLGAGGKVLASKSSTNAANWSVSFAIPDDVALSDQSYGYFVESTDKAGNKNARYYHAQSVSTLISGTATEDIIGPVDQDMAGATLLPGNKTRDQLVAISYEADAAATFTIDQNTDKPVISISVPGSNDILGQGSSAYGTVTDDDAVDRATIKGRIYNSSSTLISTVSALTTGSEGLAAYSFELPLENSGGTELPDGSYTVVFEASDTNGVTTALGAIPFKIDGSIPVIADILPGGNYIAKAASVEVSAAISDDNDVVSARMSIDDGATWSAAAEAAGRWTASVDTSAIAAGVDLLVEATDGSAKVARVRKTFQVDTNDPVVNIILPADIAAIQNGIFKVNGSSYDDNGIASTRYKLGSGAWTEADPSAQSWSITVDSRTPVPASGDLPLVIETTDNSNRIKSETFQLHIDQSLDLPSLSFLNLDPSAADAAAGLALNQLGSLAALNGRVEDDDAIVLIEAWIDGNPVAPTLGGSATSKSFTISLSSLAAGSHTIRLKATDDGSLAVKLGASAAVTDSGLVYFVVDRSAPSVPSSGLLPASNSYSKNSSYTISGESEDDWGVQKVELSINGGAYAAALLGSESLTGGLWKRSWNYPVTGDAEGVKTVRIRATDKAGKTYERELVFTIDATSPTVVYNDPRPAVDVGGTLKVNGVVTVSASIVDDYPISSTRYRIDGGAWTTTTANLAKQGISFDTEPFVGSTGSILFEFSAFDPAGNETLESQSLSVDQASDAPRLELTNLDGSLSSPAILAAAALPNLLESNPKITGSLQDDDGIDASTIQISVDGGAFVDVTQRGSSGPSVAFEHSLAALSEGVHFVSLKATDLASAKAGKSVMSATVGPVYFYIDKAAPSVAVTSPANGAQKNADFVIAGSASDANGLSGDVVVKKDGVQVATVPVVGGNWSYTVIANPDHSGDGTFAFEFVAKDPFNKQGSATLSLLVDTLAPAPAISAPAAASWNSGATLSASGTVTELNTLAAVEWSLDGSSYTPVSGTTPWTASIPIGALAEGSGKTLHLRARDGAGNVGTTTRLFGIDQNPPSTSVSALSSANALFAISGNASDGNALASVQIVQRKDGLPASDTTVLNLTGIGSATKAWTTGASLPSGGLATGSYEYTITVTDLAGKTYSPPVATVTIDLDPPTSVILDPAIGAPPLFGAAYTLSGTASDVGSGIDRVEYSLDAWATTSIAAGTGNWTATIANLAALGEGSKTLLVRAIDKAGNAQAPISSVSFVIDQSPPSIDSAFPASSYANAPWTITGSASDSNALSSVTATRSKDGGAPVAQAVTGSSNWSISLDPAVLGEGSHVFTITALDAANRTTSIERTVIVDTTDPSASFSSVSPLVGTNTVNGTISFTAAASDSNGLAGVRWAVLLDGAPVPTYATAPNSWAASPYTANLVTTTLTDASNYNLWLIARDRAGNDSVVAYPIYVLQASDKPVFALSNMDPANDTAPEAAGNLQETSAKLTGTVTDDDGVSGASLRIAIDGGAAVAVSSKTASGTGFSFEHNLASLGEGPHYFNLSATDINGSAVTFGPVYFTVDKFPAAAAVSSPSEGSRHKANFTISGTAGDFNGLASISATRTKDGLTVAQALGGSLTNWTIAVDVDTDGAGADTGLSDGSYTYSITATDNFGKTGSATIGVIIDTTAPVISILSPLAASWNRGTSLSASGTVNEANGIASVEWSTDGTSWNAVNGTADWNALVSLSGLPEGPGRTLSIRATDAAGNVGTSTRLFGIDQADPATTIVAPSSAAALFAISGNASDGNALASLVISESKDGGAEVEAYRLDAIGGTARAWSSGASLPSTGLSTGTYTYSIRVTDLAGNEKNYPDVATISIDLDAPSTVIEDPLASAILFGNSYTIRGTASDTGPSGLNEVLYSLNGGSTWIGATGTGSWSATLNLLTLGEGAFTLQVKAEDKAGNEQAAPTARSFFIDQANPSLASGAALSQNTSIGVTISGTASDTNGLRTWDHDSNGGTAEVPYVEVSANGGAAFKVNVDTGDGSWSFPVDPDTDGAGPDTGYAEGSWLFQITATDAANRSVHIDRTVVLDLSAPTVSIGTPGAGAILPAANATVTGTADDGSGVGVAEVYYSFGFSDDGNFGNDGWVLASGTAFWNASVDLGAEGPKTLSVRAKDGLGQYSAVSSVSFDLDLTPPTLSELVVGPGTQRRSGDFSLSGTASDSNGLKTWDDPTDGSALLLPYVTISVNGGPAVNVSVDADGPDDVAGNADDDTWTYGHIVNPDGSEDGDYSFTVVATDVVDKPASLTRLVTVDTTPPTIVVDGVVSGLNNATGTVNRLVGFRFGAADGGVGIAKSGASYLAYYTVVADGVVPGQTAADIAAWTPVLSASSNFSLSYDTSAVALGERDLYVGVLDAVTGAPNARAVKFDLSIDQASNLPRLSFDNLDVAAVLNSENGLGQNPSVLVTVEDDDSVDVSALRYRIDANNDGDFADVVELGTAGNKWENEGVWYPFSEIPASDRSLAQGKILLTDFPQGLFGIQVEASDTIGGDNSLAQSGIIPFAVDYGPPMLSVTSPASGTYRDSLSLALTATDALGVATVKYSLDNGATFTTVYPGPSDTSVSYGGSVDLSALPTGEYALQVLATDVGGYAATQQIPITIDKTKPVVTFLQPSPAGSTINGNQVRVSGEAQDNRLLGSVFLWHGLATVDQAGVALPSRTGSGPDDYDAGGYTRLAGKGVWTLDIDTTAVTLSPDNGYRVRVVAIDDIGNLSDPTDLLLKVDQDGDRPSILFANLDLGEPSRLGTGARIIGTLSDDDGVDASTIQIRLDRNGDGDFLDPNEGWVAVSNPSGDSIVTSWYHDISALAAASQGRKHVQLRSLDVHAPAANQAEFAAFALSTALTPSFNWNESPVVEFFIDYGPPTLSLSAPSSGARFNVDQFTLSGTTSDGNGVDYITVWVDSDNDQVQDGGEVTTIGDGPDGSYLTSDDSPYAINQLISGLSDGAKAVQVSSFDTAGAASIRDFTVVIDTTAPTASFKTPAGSGQTVNGTIEISGLAGDSYQLANVYYSVLPQAAAAPAYPAGYTALNQTYSWSFSLNTLGLGGDGTYVVRILPLDSAGNYPKAGSDPAPVSLSLVVDQTSDKPVVDVLTIDEAGTAVANLLPGSLQISGTVRDDDSVEKSSVQIRSRLLPAGVWSAWGPISGPADSNTTLIVWTHTFTGFTDGQYEFEMRAGDVNDLGAYAAYSSGGTAPVKFSVDLAPPTATIAAPAASSYHKTDVVISGSATDASGIKSVSIAYDTGSGYGAEIPLADDSGAAGYTWNASYSVDEAGHLDDGQVFFRITATDSFDKVRTYEQYFTVDTLAPTLAFLQPSANGTTLNGSVLIRGTATEANQLASVWFKANNSTGPGTWATGTPSDNGWTLLSGTYSWDGRFKSTSLTPEVGATIYVMAIDGVGNRSDPSLAANQRSFTPSLTANLPVVNFTTAGGALLDNAGTITGTVTDDDGVDASSLEISFDGGSSWRAVSAPGTDGLTVNWSHAVASGAGLPESATPYSVTVRASDLGENFDGGDFSGAQDIAPVSGISAALSVRKDDAAPSASISSIDNGFSAPTSLQGSFVSDRFTLAGDALDSVGVASVEARLVGVAGQDSFALVSPDSPGDYSSWTWAKSGLSLSGTSVNIELRSTDVNGRTALQTFAMLVDTVDPAVAFDSPGAGALLNASFVASGSITEANRVASAYYWIKDADHAEPADIADWIPASIASGWSLRFDSSQAGWTNGLKTIMVVAFDNAGNRSEVAERTVYFDQGLNRPSLRLNGVHATDFRGSANASATTSLTDSSLIGNGDIAAGWLLSFPDGSSKTVSAFNAATGQISWAGALAAAFPVGSSYELSAPTYAVDSAAANRITDDALIGLPSRTGWAVVFQDGGAAGVTRLVTAFNPGTGELTLPNLPAGVAAGTTFKLVQKTLLTTGPAVTGSITDDDSVDTASVSVAIDLDDDGDFEDDGGYQPVTTVSGTGTSVSFSHSLAGLPQGTTVYRAQLRFSDVGDLANGIAPSTTTTREILLAKDDGLPDDPVLTRFRNGYLDVDADVENRFVKDRIQLDGLATDGVGVALVEVNVNGLGYQTAGTASPWTYQRTGLSLVNGATLPVLVRVTDYWGRQTVKSFSFKADNTPPSIGTTAFARKLNGIELIQGSAADNTSAVDRIYRYQGTSAPTAFNPADPGAGSWVEIPLLTTSWNYSLDTTTDPAYNDAADHPYYLAYTAVDAAGNFRTINSANAAVTLAADGLTYSPGGQFGTVTINQDADRPVISFISIGMTTPPTPYAAANRFDANPRLSGTVQDDDGVDRGKILVSVDGAAFVPVSDPPAADGGPGGIVAFSHDLSGIGEGSHTILLRVGDLGSPAYVEAGFSRGASFAWEQSDGDASAGWQDDPSDFYYDTGAPTIAFAGLSMADRYAGAYPPGRSLSIADENAMAGTVVNNDWSLAGTATDGNLASVTVQVDAGVPTTPNLATGAAWSHAFDWINGGTGLPNVADGAKTIKITATDLFGKTTVKTLSLIFDSAPSAIALSSPADASPADLVLDAPVNGTVYLNGTLGEAALVKIGAGKTFDKLTYASGAAATTWSHSFNSGLLRNSTDSTIVGDDGAGGGIAEDGIRNGAESFLGDSDGDGVEDLDEIFVYRSKLRVSSYDASGNVEEKTYSFTIDNNSDRPLASITQPADGSYRAGEILASGLCSDDAQADDGVDLVELQVDANGDGDFGDVHAFTGGATPGAGNDPFETESAWIAVPGAQLINAAAWSYALNSSGQLNPSTTGLNGMIKIRVRATDKHGTVGAPSLPVTVFIDETYPEIKGIVAAQTAFSPGVATLVRGQTSIAALFKDDQALLSTKLFIKYNQASFAPINATNLFSATWGGAPVQALKKAGTTPVSGTSASATTTSLSSPALAGLSLQPGMVVYLNAGTRVIASYNGSDTVSWTSPLAGVSGALPFIVAEPMAIDTDGTLGGIDYSSSTGSPETLAVVLKATDETNQTSQTTIDFNVDNELPAGEFNHDGSLTFINGTKYTGLYSFKSSGTAATNILVGQISDSGTIRGVRRVGIYFVKDVDESGGYNAGDLFYSPVAGWTASTAYQAGAYRRNGTNVYRVVSTTGDSKSGLSGPSGTGASISDGNVTWAYVDDVSTGRSISGTTLSLWDSVNSGAASVPYTNDLAYSYFVDKRSENLVYDGDATFGDGDGFQESLIAKPGYDEWKVYFDTTKLPDGPIWLFMVFEDDAGNKSFQRINAQIANNPPSIDSVFTGQASPGTAYSSLVKYKNSLYLKVNASDAGGGILGSSYKATLSAKRLAPNGASTALGPALNTVYNIASTADGTAANDILIDLRETPTTSFVSGVQYTFTIEVTDTDKNKTTREVEVWVNNLDATPPSATIADFTQANLELLSVPAASINVATDLFSASLPAYAGNGTMVFFPSAAPVGLSPGTTYFIVNNGGSSFQLSATSGGAAIDVTGKTTGVSYQLYFGGHVEETTFASNDAEADLSGTVAVKGSAWDDSAVSSLNLEISYDGGSNWSALGSASLGSPTGTVIDGYTYPWTFLWNTATVTGQAKADIVIRAIPGDGTAHASPNAPPTKTVDVAPYITDIVRDAVTLKLKTYRSKFGKYSFYQGETGIVAKGYNLNPSSAGLYSASTGGTSNALTLGAIAGDYTSFAFSVPNTAKAGWFRLLVNGVEAINNANDDDQASNHVYGTDAQSSDWTDDRYALIWQVGDYFYNSNVGEPTTITSEPQHPAMTIHPSTSRLFGAWSSYATSDVFFASPNSEAAGTRYRSRIYHTYDTAEYVDIAMDESTNGLGKVALAFLGNNSSDNTYDDGHIVSFPYERATGFLNGDVSATDGQGLLPANAIQWTRGGYDNWYYQGEGLGYDSQLFQFKQVKTARNDTNDHWAYFDSQSNVVKYQYVLTTNNTETELATWLNIDGATGDTDGGENGRQVANGIARTGKAGEFLALTLDEDGLPLIVYYDMDNQLLRLARADNVAPTGIANWTRQEVLLPGDPNRSPNGKHIAAVVDGGGILHIAFWSDDTGNLYYVKSTNNPEGGAAYTFGNSVVVDATGTAGLWADISLDRSTNTPYISYLNSSRLNTKDGLKVAWYDSSAAAFEWAVVASSAVVVEKRTSIEYKRGGTPTSPNGAWDAAVCFASPTRVELVYLMPKQ